MKTNILIGLLAVSLFSSCGSDELKDKSITTEVKLNDTTSFNTESIAKVEKIEPKTVATSGEVIATFEYVELGDYYHLIFKDDKGEEWDFGYGQNNYVSYDFGDDQSNPDLVGKKFKIVWENKKVNSYDLKGKDYTMDALCIVEIGLIK
ncbi:MAG: hypothetical protein CVT95_05410 [Bacteroidetes bacterium HGW-Bacteroidetes-12]|jgi:hypothetical protein|nr:MAG: hypothetical protein CVT95_05410 [Bacteroidetes bacterium HGW-Bacteroidetes-12]